MVNIGFSVRDTNTSTCGIHCQESDAGVLERIQNRGEHPVGIPDPVIGHADTNADKIASLNWFILAFIFVSATSISLPLLLS